MNKTPPEILQQLRAEEEQAAAELQAAKDAQANASRRVTSATNLMEEARRKLAEASVGKAQPLHITDHAMLRLLERYYDIPVDKLRYSFADRVKKYAGLGDGRFPVADDMFAVVKNNSVVTVVPK